MNYRVTHAPIWNTSNIQRGVVVADTAEQARQIFVVSGCEVLEVEELHPVEQATALEAQYEKPQADEADWFTNTASERNDSIISRNDWDFTPVQNMPIIDMDKIDEIPL